MFRFVCWLLLVAFLIVVGVWPSAVAPVEWVSAGASVVLAAIPGPVLVAGAVVTWLKFKPAPAASARTARA